MMWLHGNCSFFTFLQNFSYYLYYNRHAILPFIIVDCMRIIASSAPLGLCTFLYIPHSAQHSVRTKNRSSSLLLLQMLLKLVNVPLKTWHSLLKTIFQKWSGQSGESLTSCPSHQTTLLLTQSNTSLALLTAISAFWCEKTHGLFQEDC